MIISRTPFRVSFFGGGTDFPEYYTEHGGATLLSTIDRYCYISVHELSPFFTYRFRASYARTELVQQPEEFQHPLIRECLRYLGIRDGLEIAHVSDLPGRTGLGTSSAFTVGLLHALHAFRDDKIQAEELAREAIVVERERVGDAGGHQDQYAAAYGGFIRLDCSGSKGVEVRRPRITADRLRELEQRLLMFYIGSELSAQTILQNQRKRTTQNMTTLDAMRNLVDKAERILESTDDLGGWGDLLHESWTQKKSLASGISNSMVDDAYAAARKAGAHGGKLLGAGGRGFLLFYIEPDQQDTVRAALHTLLEVPFRFGHEGSRIIFRTTD